MKMHRSERHFGLDNNMDHFRHIKVTKKVSKLSLFMTFCVYFVILGTFAYFGLQTMEYFIK